MSAAYYTRPVRRSSITDTEPDEGVGEEESVYHAPYLHEDCEQCEAALLEAINEDQWQSEELLPALNEAYFNQMECDPFSIYRHFHPYYSFNYSPYERQFKPIALAGKRPGTDLRIGDVLLMRSILSNNTKQAVITEPRLRSHLDLGTAIAQKPGLYARVYGNVGGNYNSNGFIRVLDNYNRTPDDVIIIRKINYGEGEAYDESAEALAESPSPNLKYRKYGKSGGGGYMYAGDRSINYGQLIAENNLSDFEAKTARHFLETEGGIDSINTYDNQVVTWGFGFAGKSGNLMIALYHLFSSNEAARKEFNSNGIFLTSEKKGDLSITADGQTYTGDDALKFWKLSEPFLNILIQLSQKYAKDVFNAQWQTFKRIHRQVFTAFDDPSFLANITDEVERNKAKAAVLHAHHHYPAFNPPAAYRNASSFEEVLTIYVTRSSRYGSVQGTANHWRTSLNKIFSGSAPAPGPTPPTPTPTPPDPATMSLRGSVGRGGQNNVEDVLKVQSLLIAAGIPILVTGFIQDNEGDVTILAIYHYQAKKKLKSYDGRIDPNGSTIKALMRGS
ncbi:MULTISPECIES: hypothetical protein [Niastella]|uniref:Uncharacterized protein n=1 Tax=Niastella soli TaxID=2821487 RepID=A0ABS3Z5L3_9BACT|nr:hypothetical protein [Niastella soli]MBO9205460.1 hypothetical protein [Niastella soli]